VLITWGGKSEDDNGGCCTLHCSSAGVSCHSARSRCKTQG